MHKCPLLEAKQTMSPSTGQCRLLTPISDMAIAGHRRTYLLFTNSISPSSARRCPHRIARGYVEDGG